MTPSGAPPAGFARDGGALPWQLVQNLQQRADFEGRSLSNLIAYLLEAAG
jgi:hypothetical protein